MPYLTLEREAPPQFHGRSLPRDVSTHWNLTYDHLAAFIQLEEYIDKFTGIREHGLRDFKLTKVEWDCVKHLVKVLQVSCIRILVGISYSQVTIFRS